MAQPKSKKCSDYHLMASTMVLNVERRARIKTLCGELLFLKSEHEAEIQSLQTKLVKLEKDAASASSSTAECESHIEELQSEIKKLTREINLWKSKVDILNSDLKHFQNKSEHW